MRRISEISRGEILILSFKTALSFAWLSFQVYIAFFPQAPLLQRPIHLTFAIAVLLLAKPLPRIRQYGQAAIFVDLSLLASVTAVLIYYLSEVRRLTERIEGIDEVLPIDIFFSCLLLGLLLEGVRRTVGWSLLSVLFLFLLYGFAGSIFPGWLRFSGFTLHEGVEILSMTVNGILGITTATSLQFVFYFVLFGAVYSAIGGGQLFIDIGLMIAGRHKGAGAKAAVVASSLMGSISGSAVANVATTGVFTVPLMRKSGYSASMAGAIEAIASTGGQLMPPIMGVAAFVIAEMLQVSYSRIALAGLIPALAFYIAIFVFVDLLARRDNALLAPSEALEKRRPIAPRFYLLFPPVILVAVLSVGYSATYAAISATATCVFIALFTRKKKSAVATFTNTLEQAMSQAAHVAVPIAAIGIIIAVAIQSNLALKFSSQLISGSGESLYEAMILIILGCLLMGMGLPTVAAYIIGAILFVPALLRLGIPEMSAHFFVMYYCVLSMVTPPVALASYTAAAIAKSHPMKTSLQAFRLALVSFFIPVAFVFDPRLLGEGTVTGVLIAAISLSVGTTLWAVALAGYFGRVLRVSERILIGIGALNLICSLAGSVMWFSTFAVLVVLLTWVLFTLKRTEALTR